MMDLSLAFNIATALVAFLGGWLVKVIRDDIAALRAADQAMADKTSLELAAVRAELAGMRAELPDRFVRRDDFKEALDAIFNLLRRIEDKVEKKADRE